MTLGENITVIEGHAFYNCQKLTTVTMYDRVTTVESGAFAHCLKLENVYYSGTKEQWQEIMFGGSNSYFEYREVCNHIHDYTAVAPVVVEPTCTEDGYVEHICIHGDSYRDVLPNLGGHIPEGETQIVAPTCTEEGYTLTSCTRCGEGVPSEFVPATGHSFTDDVCTVCGAPKRAPGDLDDTEGVTTNDVVVMLLYLSMPDVFPLPEGVNADFSGDGAVTTDDAVVLLLHISMPDIFPLTPAKTEE